MKLMRMLARSRLRRAPFRRVIARNALTAWGGASLAGVLGLALVYGARGIAEAPPDVALAAEDIAPIDPLEPTPSPVVDAAAAPAAEKAPIRIARVPRARPDEPMITGSIRPAIEPAEEPAMSDRPSGGGLVELKRLYDQRKLVASIAGGSNGGVTLDQLLSGPAAPAPLPVRAASLSDAEAISACEDNLRIGLPVPASYKRILASTGIFRAPGNDAVVTFDFEAVNGFGYAMALQVQCVFQGYSLARLDVGPR